MALTDFFRINLPYGITKNKNGEWAAFNREYVSLGFNDDHLKHLENYPIFTKYKGITEKKLLKIAHHEDDGIQRDDSGNIIKVFLYNDGSNPMNDSKSWDTYFEKIKLLSSFKVDRGF